MPRFQKLLALLLAGLLVSFTGCAKSVRKVSIEGKITNNGQPLTTSTKGFVQVIFHPAAASDPKAVTPVPAVVDSQAGTYKVSEIPVGKYKVVVQQMDPAPVTDKLKGAFDLGRTKIVREVTEDGTLDIDLAKP
jgi:hypothetical protein